MPRVKRGTHRRDTRHKTLERASGYFLTKSKLNRAAQEAVEKVAGLVENDQFAANIEDFINAGMFGQGRQRSIVFDRLEPELHKEIVTRAKARVHFPLKAFQWKSRDSFVCCAA